MTSIRRLLDTRMRPQADEEKSGVRRPEQVRIPGLQLPLRAGEGGEEVAVGGSLTSCMGRRRPIPDRLDIALLAVYAGGGRGIGRHRRHDQADSPNGWPRSKPCGATFTPLQVSV